MVAILWRLLGAEDVVSCGAATGLSLRDLTFIQHDAPPSIFLVAAMCDDFFSFEALEREEGIRIGSTRFNLPIKVLSYDTSATDQAAHTLHGYRLDGDAFEPMALRIAPMAGPVSNGRKRPEIIHFEGRELLRAEALGHDATSALLVDPRHQVRTEIGGVVRADQAEEVEPGVFVCEWLTPLAKSDGDPRSPVFVGWARALPVRYSGGGRNRATQDIEIFHTESSITARSPDELWSGMVGALSADYHRGRPSLILRGHKDDPTTGVKKVIILSAQQPRVDLTDTRQGNSWKRQPPDQVVSVYRRTGAGSKLNNPAVWTGSMAVEVIPVSVVQVGPKTLADNLKSQYPLDHWYRLPQEGEGGAPGPAAVAFSSVGLRAVGEGGPGNFIAASARPVRRGLRPLVDLPTNCYEPSAEEEDPSFDFAPAGPLTEGFSL